MIKIKKELRESKNMESYHQELQDLLCSFLKNNPEKIRGLADELLVSLPTLKRWANGKNFPNLKICPAIIKHLKKKMRAGS